ncbi:MAG TPA: L-threonylcarbamoyladenylate synthase [Roseiflexaceae bacterium]|nr:L-threonylcarbamoyladenylate synthase [Roseiflexaceae bacterium]
MNQSQTLLVTVDLAAPDPVAIAQAAALLRAGGLVAFPTETVYGLGANARDPQAVARIYQAKGRPASDPLIVHIAALDQLALVALDVPPQALALARLFWPGPLTLVLRRHPDIAENVAAGTPTVAVRMPDHPVALALIAAAGVPVAAPSANLFARPSPTTAQHVLEDLAGRIDLVLDAGAARIGLESTVVSLSEQPPAVLRPGGVPLEALRQAVPGIALRARYLRPEEQEAAAPSPGMLLKHYSPRAELLLFSGPTESVLERMCAVALREQASGRRVGLLLPDEDRARFADLPVELHALGPQADLAAVGAHLFDGLRALDRLGVDLILARGLAREGLGLAIWDRLLRATEGRVVVVEDGEA